ncbi:MAG: PAS domain S-box protein [bacterium]|nr:PAS domain S-box protein [bacterium]
MADEHPDIGGPTSDNEESLYAALRELYDAMWDWNLETDEVYYSPAWKRMLGYRVEELAPSLDTWSTLCHPDDRARVLQAIDDYLASDGDRFECEFRLQHADGKWRQILSRGVLVRDADGAPLKPRRIIGTHVDLSGHATVEKRLAHSLSLLRATFDSTADGILVADGQGRIETFNQRFVQLWQLPADVLAGGDDNAALAFVLDQLIDPDGFLAKVNDLYAHPDAESFDVLHFKDGRVFERYSRPQRMGNLVVGRVWSFRDVTGREQAATELAEEVLRRRALFDQSRDGIVVIDMNGAALECNARFAEMLGCTVAKVSTMHVWDWDVTMSADAIRQRFLSVPLAPHQFRTRHRRSDGSTFDVEISSGTLFWKGQPQYLCTVRDITDRLRDEEERRQLQEQLLQAQKMDAIGQLTGGIAHEFNNMLGVILGYASLAGEIAAEKGDTALVDYVGAMRRAGENARDLVAKLLAFGRRRPAAMRSPQDPVDLLQGSLRLLRPTLPTSLKIDVEMKEQLPAVAVDPMEFQQVVANLLLNAAQATGQQGHIALALRAWEGEGTCAACRLPIAGRFVALDVADDGAGMTPEVRERIFEPFFTTKDVGRGTGLGLSVVHGIAHASGGHMLVTSRVGIGTTFTLLLPLAETAAVPTPVPMPASTAGPDVMRTFMVVDDQVEVADLLAQMLASRGHRALVFENAETALAAFRAAPGDYDAVISDQTMPGMSGRDLLVAIRDIRPGLPLVIWTGFSESIDEAAAADLGFAGFMRKPVTMEDLEGLLQRLFQEAL